MHCPVVPRGDAFSATLSTTVAGHLVFPHMGPAPHTPTEALTKAVNIYNSSTSPAEIPCALKWLAELIDTSRSLWLLEPSLYLPLWRDGIAVRICLPGGPHPQSSVSSHPINAR